MAHLLRIPFKDEISERHAQRGQRATVQVLEGEWPYEGFVALEKFTSMKDVLNFWNSDGYQAAKKLRADAIKFDFIIAVEGGR